MGIPIDGPTFWERPGPTGRCRTDRLPGVHPKDLYLSGGRGTSGVRCGGVTLW